MSSRDPAGRIERFRDAGDREFQLIYDSQGRLTSSKATQGAHLSDVNVVVYDAQDRIGGVALGSGYELHFHYLEDGTQVARDRYGGLISRRGSLGDGYTVLQLSDPSGRLVSAIGGLDDLLRAANQTN